MAHLPKYYGPHPKDETRSDVDKAVDDIIKTLDPDNVKKIEATPKSNPRPGHTISEFFCQPGSRQSLSDPMLEVAVTNNHDRTIKVIIEAI